MVNRITELAPIQAPRFTPSASSYQLSKPTLSPTLRLIEFHKKFGKTEKEISHRTLDLLEAVFKDIQQYSGEELTHKEQESWITTIWGYFSYATTACTSLFSIFMGVTSVGIPPYAGLALLASGTMDIMQTLFNHYGTWDKIIDALAEKDEDYRQKLKQYTPLLALAVRTLLSGLSAEALKNQAELVRGFKAFLDYATKAGEFGFGMARSYSDIEGAKISAKLEPLKNDMTFLSRAVGDLSNKAREVKSMIKKPLNQQMRAAIEASRKI